LGIKIITGSIVMLILPPSWEKAWKGKDVYKLLSDMPGEIFRDVPGRLTKRFEKDGRYYFVKLHQGLGWRYILKSLLSHLEKKLTLLMQNKCEPED